MQDATLIVCSVQKGLPDIRQTTKTGSFADGLAVRYELGWMINTQTGIGNRVVRAFAVFGLKVEEFDAEAAEAIRREYVTARDN